MLELLLLEWELELLEVVGDEWLDDELDELDEEVVVVVLVELLLLLLEEVVLELEDEDDVVVVSEKILMKFTTQYPSS